MSRPLFTLDYEGSPFEHGWQQYDPVEVVYDCLTIGRDPQTQEPILVKKGGLGSAVSYLGLGNWIKAREPIYIATVRPESDFHIYFNVHSASGESRYLVYGTTGKTGPNASGEYALVLEGRNLHDGSWHSLVFDIRQDIETCFEREFYHLNWICLRGNIEISEFLAIPSNAELMEVWQQLKFPFLISAESLIGRNAHPSRHQGISKTTDEIASLRRQWDVARDNLRFIRERKSQYVLEIDIPLQLIKEEQHLLKRIEELEQCIEELEKAFQQRPSRLEGALSRKRVTQLLQILDKHFNEGELQTLCFHLGVDYDNLPGKAKADKARELIKYLGRRIRIPELVETGRRLRPDIPWPEATGEG